MCGSRRCCCLCRAPPRAKGWRAGGSAGSAGGDFEVSCVAAGAARNAAAAVVQGWRSAVAGVAGALQVGYGPVEGCVDEPGPETREAHHGQ